MDTRPLKEQLDQAWNNGTLREAARDLDAQTVQWALEQGADPNTHDGQGCPILIEAARLNGSCRIVKLLLAAGANPNATFLNKPAVQWARRFENPRVVKLIEEAAIGKIPKVRRRVSRIPEPRVIEILSQLEESDFPALDNGYIYLIDVRLHAFSDSFRWALVIEVLGVQNRSEGEQRQINNALYAYGNCLRTAPGLPTFLYPTSDGPEGPTFSIEGVHPEARTLRIRDQVVQIIRDPELYFAKGIKLNARGPILPHELARCLVPENRNLLLATNAEIRQLIPSDLPEVLRLEEWRHPDVGAGIRIGESRTFISIATVLSTGDGSRYKSVGKSNTHWKHWRTSGIL